jgi:hypothetical protein
VTDHGQLTGLDDDDHPQYLTEPRADARYSQLGHTHPGGPDAEPTMTARVNGSSGIVVPGLTGPATGTWWEAPLDAVDFDTFPGGCSDGRGITIPANLSPGIYDVVYTFRANSNQVGGRAARLVINGASTGSATTSIRAVNDAFTQAGQAAVLILNPGDVLRLELGQTSGDSLTFTGGPTGLSVTRRGPVISP